MTRASTVSGLLLVFISTIVWLIVYLPPFERTVYNENERTNYEETMVYGGYKAGPSIPRYTSIDDYIINLPSKGTVVLPVCGEQNDIDLSIYNANYGAYDSYWNFAT